MNSLSTMLANAQAQQDAALDQLARDIREAHEHHVQARGSGVMYGVELGNLLRRAKNGLKHGQFKPWIEAQFKDQFKYAWASVCMQASEAFQYLIENQISTQVDICSQYESIRDLAAGRDLAKDGKDPQTTQRVLRPKVKKPKVSTQEAEEVYREDVASEVNRTVDTREVELLARISELEDALEKAVEPICAYLLKDRESQARISELETQLAAANARIAELETKPKRATKPLTEFQRFCVHPDVVEFRRLFGGGERALFNKNGRDADAAIAMCTRTVTEQHALMARNAKRERSEI